MSMDFKVFQVGDEYIEIIVAETPEQALNYYNGRVDDDYKVTIADVSEIPISRIGKFETENGFREMTFDEFLNNGDRFIYKKPQEIAWIE